MLSPAPHIDFYSAADGYRCAVRVWKAERPVGRVVWVHGIISHGGWYFGSCRHLAAAGLEVHFLDRRGSGLNAADRGHVDRWETWVRDVEIYLERLEWEKLRTNYDFAWEELNALGLQYEHFYEDNGWLHVHELVIEPVGAQ